MFQSSNPALSDRVFEGIRPVGSNAEAMTIDGAVNKTLVCLFLLCISAYWSYGNPIVMAWYLPAIIVGAVVSIATMFKNSWAPYTAPIYALVEGVVLGAISFMFSSLYDGIIWQAVLITFGVMSAMLFGYKSGLIKVNNTFIMIVTSATAGIAIFYLISLVASLFGYPFTFMQSSSPLSIGISLVVCAVASLSLVLDFHRIDQLAKSGNAPKYMEWYSALALLITLIWLYIEILNLLRKLQSRE